MQKNLLTIIAVTILTVGLSANSFAQIGNILNKAKDTIDKKKKDQPKTNPNSSDATKTSSRAADSAPAPIQNELGAIYFSNQPFPADGSVSGAKTSFSSNEFIYGRLVLKNGTIREVLKPASPEANINNNGDKIKGYNVDFRLYTIEKTSYSSSIRDIGRIYKAIINEADLDKKYWDFDVLPSPTTANSLFYWGGNPNDGMTYAFDLYLFMNKSDTKEGNREIILSIKTNGVDFRGNPLPDSERSEIEGKFNFNFRGADYGKVKANYDSLEKDFASNYRKIKIANQEAPPEWTAKSSPIIGGMTAASVQNLYVNSFATGGGSLKVIKLYAAPPKGQGMWIIQNNDYGIPSYRYSTQYFTAFVRDASNGVCYFQGFGLRQNYAGAGTYGKTIIDHGESALIKCEKLGLK